jgi:hypothetical protein
VHGDNRLWHQSRGTQADHSVIPYLDSPPGITQVVSMISLQRSMHSLQIVARGPTTMARTERLDFVQKLHSPRSSARTNRVDSPLIGCGATPPVIISATAGTQG